MAAADTFSNEGLGMSLLWDKSKDIEDFVTTVNQHVDAALYVSRTTGKFVLKAIRGDYDEEDFAVAGRKQHSKRNKPGKAFVRRTYQFGYGHLLGCFDGQRRDRYHNGPRACSATGRSYQRAYSVSRLYERA